MAERAFDVIVIGAGPAGLAAASVAAECKLKVACLDENSTAGGQIWRASEGAPHSDSVKWINRFQLSGATLYCGATVIASAGAKKLMVHFSGGRTAEFTYQKLILATGARELFLPFPGWTLPGVVGAGGLQALVKSGLDVSGKRVVVSGSGPLLLAVACHLRDRDAEIVRLVEQVSFKRTLSLGRSLLRQPSKLLQALKLQASLVRVQKNHGTWVVQAKGETRLESVVLSSGEELKCDWLACSYGLVPNTELAQLLGCKVVEGRVQVNDEAQTTQDDIYAVGELTGIGGVHVSILEGLCAGYAVADVPSPAHLQRKLEGARDFARNLESTFKLRRELIDVPAPETVICRCEDVPYGQVTQYGSKREAKIQTRCGMGACQGRVCGPALRFLCGWADDSVREPLYPAEMDAFLND